MTTHTVRRWNHRGFTLVEVMVTLVIFSFVMAMAYPALQKANRTHQLQAAAGRVETALTRARATAVTQQTPVRVSFNPVTSSLLLEQDTNNDGDFNQLMRTVIINGNVNFNSITFAGGNTVIFDSRGAPDNPGTIIMNNGGDESKRLLVSAGSGAVSVTSVAAENPYSFEGLSTRPQ